MAKSLYGVTPWGAWFIEVLDSYKMGARLDRGRTYANTGRVLSLDLKDGHALAKVEGNYRPFYRVEIVFPALKEKEKVFRMIEDDPALLARIAAGELPEAFLKKLRAAGIELIPKRWRDMKRSCNCPDDGDPCKHMAALYYIIAREIDADPRVLFRLRGMDLAEHFGESLAASLLPPFIVESAKQIRSNQSAKSLRSTNATISVEPAIPKEAPVLPEIPHCAELIISLLPPNPPFSDRNFNLALAEFYHKASRWEPWDSADTQENANADNELAAYSVERRFSRSRWSVICPQPEPGAQPVLLAEDVLGNKTHHTLYDAFLAFRTFSSEEGTGEYTFLFYLFKFLNLLCTSCALIPFVFLNDEKLQIIWKPFDTLPEINEALNTLAQYECGLLALKSTEGKKAKAQAAHVKEKANAARVKEKPAKGSAVFASGRSVIDLLSSAFMGEWVKENYFAYNGAAQPGSREYRELLEVFFRGKALNVKSPALRSLPINIDRWLSVLHTGLAGYKYRFTVKASRNNGDDEVDDFTLSMDMLLETEKGIEAIPLSRVAKKPLKETAALPESIAALRSPTALSNYLPEIRDLFSHPKVQLSEVRLVSFLDEAAPLLSRLGIEVVLPKALSRELRPRLVLKTEGKEKGKGSLVSYLALDKLLNWNWQIAVGDKVMDIDEFEKLVKQKRALVRFKDGFVRMEPEELAQLLKKAHEGEPKQQDFLKAHFSGNSILSFDAEGIIKKLFEERRFPVPKTLSAELRPYQKRGYNWVCSLLMAGFGCILADDMGLGKTVQSIAALLRLKEEGLLGNGCLIIAPAALLENWERELHRFAPSVNVSRYHGAQRSLVRGKPGTPGAKKSAEVFLTTYQTAVRDTVKLEKEPFSLLIVDEAHLMKNADTRGARTVKRLRSNYRLALSGTPVENRLEDLRSLFDFILPGYLGTPEEFKKSWRVPIEVMRKKETACALQKITSPFLLRRLKTDKSIITDLPEKISVNEYAALEAEQAALYESVVGETMNKSEHIDPKERPALVLSLLTSLKQICDHPRVFDKQSPAVSKLSGKAQLLITLLEEILGNGEKVLIFSQYVETLDCLSRIITAELGEGVLTYHGGMAQKKRSETINIFQTDPSCRILLVSLRAGGLGLNLTAASRVIHYDLWYNPAVENQATDRAFRIGQRRNVFVHRFITKNSFEEKIDEMISAKRELAEMTVSSGESWLARMSHEELKALFTR